MSDKELPIEPEETPEEDLSARMRRLLEGDTQESGLPDAHTRPIESPEEIESPDLAETQLLGIS